MMETQIIEAITTQGLGAVLSVALLFYIIKTQEQRDKAQNEREENYHKLLTELSQKFEIIKEIKTDIDKLKKTIIK